MLSAAGIPCTIVLDAAVGYYIERMDMILVGAEGVVENGGLINQVIYPHMHTYTHIDTYTHVYILFLLLCLVLIYFIVLVDRHLSDECHGKIGWQAILCTGRKLQVCPPVSSQSIWFAKRVQ